MKLNYKFAHLKITRVRKIKHLQCAPNAVAVSMYGIAKKNGGWHGVKLNAQ